MIATHDGNDALSFADNMMVIQNNQLIANDTPQNLFENPKIKYVATLFDDINEVLFNNKTHLLYPHQLKVVEKSDAKLSSEQDLKAIVLNSYFKGSFWLIEVTYDGGKVFVKHTNSLEKNTKIHLQVFLN